MQKRNKGAVAAPPAPRITLPMARSLSTADVLAATMGRLHNRSVERVLSQLIETFNSHAASVEESITALREHLRDVERRIAPVPRETPGEPGSRVLVLVHAKS